MLIWRHLPEGWGVAGTFSRGVALASAIFVLSLTLLVQVGTKGHSILLRPCKSRGWTPPPALSRCLGKAGGRAEPFECLTLVARGYLHAWAPWDCNHQNELKT